MSRDDGFAIADIDSGLLADPKIVALARRLRDPVQTAAHIALYVGLVLASWGAGQCLTFGDALPAWWLEDADEIRANLTAVGLIDDSGRIPEHAWEAWFRPAWKRREDRRAAGSKGGKSKGRQVDNLPPVDVRPSTAQAAPEQRQSVAQPDRSVRTGPSSPSASGPSTPTVVRARSAREIGVDRV